MPGGDRRQRGAYAGHGGHSLSHAHRLRTLFGKRNQLRIRANTQVGTR